MKALKRKKPKKKGRKKYRRQLTDRITTAGELHNFFPMLNPEEIDRVIKRYPFGITPYFLSLIDKKKGLDDPLARQVLPSPDELKEDDREIRKNDPFGEKEKQLVPGLIKRYPDRAIILTTSECPSLCRYCTRKWNWKSGYTLNSRKMKNIIGCLKKNPSIREIILSGGEPFLLGTKKLENIIASLLEIDHIKTLRIGTRILSFLPYRITKGLTGMLSKYKPVWIITHFNHPGEITREAVKGIDRLISAGTVICNHTVLLKGVNDKFETLRELFHKLQENRVKPYYLFQCDKVAGTAHFSTPVELGLDIIDKLQGHTGGVAIPQFIIDAPGGGKIPLLPRYMIKKEDRIATLLTYDKKTITYNL